MNSFEITNSKKLMTDLLTGERFDSFLLYSAVIKKEMTYSFDGMVNRDYYTEDDQPEYEYVQWKDIKQHMFDIFKGKKLPLEFKFILYLKPEIKEQLMIKEEITAAEVKDFILNIYYKEGKITATSGVAITTFSLDKSAEKLWDTASARLMNDY